MTPIEHRQTAQDKQMIAEVRKYPPFAEFLQSGEDRAYAHREALVAERAALPAKLDAAAVAAGRAANAAAVALEHARAEVMRLTDVHMQAEMAALGAGTQIDVELARIDGELLGTADPRLAQLVRDMRDFVHGPLLRGVSNASRKKFNFWTGQSVMVQHTNAAQVQAIEASARRVIEQAQAAQLKALRRDEVTALIAGWLADLQREMRGAGIKFLALDENGNFSHPHGRGQDLANALEGRIKGLKLKEAA